MLFGVHTENFADEVSAIVAVSPEARVRNASELAERLVEWLEDPWKLDDILAQQRRALPDPAAVGARYLELLSHLLTRALGEPRR